MASLAAAAAASKLKNLSINMFSKHGPGILEAVEEKTGKFIDSEVNRLKKKLNPNNPNNRKPTNNGYKPLPVGTAAGQINMGNSPPM